MPEEIENQPAIMPVVEEGGISGPVGAALLALGGIGPARTQEQLRDILEQALFHVSPDQAEWLIGEPPDKLISIVNYLTLSLADNLMTFKRPQEAHDARRLYRRLDSIRSWSSALWARAKYNLAFSELQCGHHDRPAALARAAVAYRAALEVWTPEADPEHWVDATAGLSEVLRDASIDEPAKCRDEAVDMLKAALKTAGDRLSDFSRAKLLGSLGSALMLRGARRNIADVDEAIECKRRAYALLDAQSHQHAKINQRMDLGIALCRRAEMLGTGSQEARETLEATLAECDQVAEPLQWADVAGNYAIALKEAANATNDDIRRAIDLLKDAIRIQEQAGVWWAWAGNQNNLANALLKVSGDDPVAVTDEAANAYEAALTVWTREAHPLEWAFTTARLANANRQRASMTGRAELYQMALDGFDAALSTLSPDRNPLDWVRIMNHRAGLLKDAAERQPEPIDALRAALVAYDAAANVARDLSPMIWAQIRHNVGTVHRNLAELTEGPAHLAASAKAYLDALEARPREIDQIEWAQTSAALARILAQVGLVKMAYEYSLKAGRAELYQTEWSEMSTVFADILARGDLMNEALRRFREALEIARRMGSASDTRNIATGLGSTLVDIDDWSGAADAYEIAVGAAEQEYLAAILRGSREIVLADLAALATTAAYARARAGDAAAATIMIERARARLLGEALELDADALRASIRDDPQHGPALLAAAEELRQVDSAAIRLIDEVDNMAPDADRYRRRAEQALRERRRDARDTFAAMMSELRKKTEGRHPDVNPGLPVAYLLVTYHGGLILLWTPRKVQAIEIAEFNTAMLVELLRDEAGRPGPLSKRVGGVWGREEQAALEMVLGRAMPAIGEALCAPLAAALRDLKAKAVALVPCGRLAVLPLHAAPYAVAETTSCLLDEFIVSYAPSLSVLRAATAAAMRRATTASHIAAVLDPHGDLPFAVPEMAAIHDRFGDRCVTLRGRSANRTAVFAAIKPATHIHFACHGRTISDHPLDSHLALADGERMSLLDLFTAGARALPSARLVVASACETAAIGDDEIPNEVVGLPAGFLQLGVPGFVGTLWPVGDLPSALLIARFYELILPARRKDALPPAVALCRAQTWLRDLDGNGLTEFLATHPHLASDAGAFARLAERDPERRLFAALSVWSAHVHVGALRAA